MLSKEKPEEFYSRFHEQLLASQEWPGAYLFKFIVREGEVKEHILKALFEKMKAKFTKKLFEKTRLLAFQSWQLLKTRGRSLLFIKKHIKSKG